MKFEETTESILLPNITGAIIYFLIDGEEVVYVGQSKIGATRTYSHATKDFEKISIIRCKEEDLDYLETMYIQKYKPKYNKTILGTYIYSFHRMKKLIRENTYFKDFVLHDLKWIIKKLGIKTETFESSVYINKDDFDKIIDFIETNKYVISKNKYSWKECLK